MPEPITTPTTANPLRPLLSAIVPGVLSGVIIVIMSVSFAALIFSGRLAEFVAEGIAIAINTAIVAGLSITLFSKTRPVISMVDEDTAPVFALLVTSAVAVLPASATSLEVLASAITVIIAATFLTGTALTLLGALGFGKFIQFLPHSVMGGYFAAVGWLLVVGGLRVTVDPLGDLDSVGASLALSQAFRWAPAIGVAAALYLLKRRVPGSILLPGTVLLAILAWQLVLRLSNESIESAMQAGLLLGPFRHGADLLALFGGIELGAIEWGGILAGSGTVASILLIAALSLMLCLSGIALKTRAEPDMNRELRVAGFANVASAVGGGMTGLPSYTLSSLAIDMGGTGNRWVGILAVLVCALVFLFGLGIVAYMPRFVLGGILIYLGATLLHEWLIEGRHKFSPLEYIVIPIILLVSVVAGFLQGVVVGLVAAIVLFVIKYSRTRVVRYAATGTEIMSNVDRVSAVADLIQDNGDRLLALGLQGYLFFGTAGQVYSRIRERVAATGRPEIEFLILDFTQVTGLDASAALNLQKILQLGNARRFHVIACGLREELRERLEKGGFGDEGGDVLSYQPDLDRSLERFEERIIAEHPEQKRPIGCFEQLGDFLTADETQVLKRYMQVRAVESGEVLARQGDLSDELFFLETCAASAYIETESGESHRVRHTTRGTVFGELGFYLRIPRTASVITDDAGEIYVLDRAALLRMEEDDPAVAAGLNRYMAMLLSERLMFTTRTLRAFLI